MKRFTIEIAGSKTPHRDRIVVSEKDLLEARQKASEAPVTPILVSHIRKKADEKGLEIVGEDAVLFQIARDILVEKEGTATIQGRRIRPEKAVPAPLEAAGRQPLHAHPVR